MTKVSAIMPVYNTEKYLKSSISSLLYQTIDSIEIILVNDASTDNSLEILKYYEKMYPYKIRVYNLEKNSGLSHARNYGLSKASGEFIYFMDSDDVVSINFLNDFYNACKKEDINIGVSNCFRILKNEKVGDNDIFLGDDTSNCKVVTFSNNSSKLFSSTPAVWDKIFKHDIIPNNPFLDGKIFEDISFTYPLLLKCDAVIKWTRNDYAYRYTPNGIMESQYKVNSKILDIVDICKYNLEFGKKLGLGERELSLLNDVNKRYLLQKMHSMSSWNLNEKDKDYILRQYGSVCTQLFGNLLLFENNVPNNYKLGVYNEFSKYLVAGSKGYSEQQLRKLRSKLEKKEL